MRPPQAAILATPPLTHFPTPTGSFHEWIKVRDDAASGFVLDMLGDAFFSNRDGAMSKSALDGKVLGIYFQGTSGPNSKLLKGLQLLYKKKGTPSATGKEVGGDGAA